ncbi:MAG: tetratricopeptide (TPR) repeat protein [Flavobacteriaceae bacterium]|jgi:tetratricopeptide (TPR) repeat protein
MVLNGVVAQSKFEQEDRLFIQEVNRNMEQARKHLDRQSTLMKSSENKADYWLNSLMYYYKNNVLDSVSFAMKNARKFIQPIDDNRWATYYRFKSLTRWKMGDYGQANQILFDVIYRNKVKSELAKAHLYNTVLANYISLEEYDSARYVTAQVDELLLSENAVKEKESEGYKKLYQLNVMSIGNIMYYTAQYDSSLFYYRRAYDFARKNTDETMQTQCLGLIADVLTVKGDYEKAKNYYYRVIALFEKQPKGIGLAHAYFNLGDNYKCQENEKQSLRFYRKALALSGQLNYDLIYGHSLQEIGEHFYLQNQLDSAKNYVLASLPYLSKIGNERGICQAKCYLARIISNESGQRDKAFQLVREAKVLGIVNQSLESAQLVNETLYELFENYGMADSALIYFKRAQSIQDSINGIAVQQNMNDLEVRYETRIKEEENVLLKVEMAGKDAELERKEKERKFWRVIVLLSGLTILMLLGIGYTVLKFRRQKFDIKEKELSHSEQLKRLLIRKLDEAKTSIEEANEEIDSLKNQQINLPETVKLSEDLLEKMTNGKDWAGFMVEFELIYTTFFKKMQMHSTGSFTRGERRLLALIKLGLSNQEMTDYLFISLDSVKKSKNRLFKKIELTTDYEKASDFIRSA